MTLLLLEFLWQHCEKNWSLRKMECNTYINHDIDKKGIAEIIIAKQRNGPIGTVELVWLPDYTKFANMKK